MRLDHIGLPNEIKTMKYLWQKDGDALLVSYVGIKKSMLSVRVTKD